MTAKECINIGCPVEVPEAPRRRSVDELLRFMS